MGNLAEDQSNIIKPGKEGPYLVIWDQEDYLAEAYRKWRDHSLSTDVKKLIENFYLPH